MEEMLKIVYWSFLDDETDNTCIRIMDKSWETTEDVLAELQDILSKKIFDEIYNKIRMGAYDLQEAAFIAGFAQCAKFMSNGKIDFFPVQNSAGGEIV